MASQIWLPGSSLPVLPYNNSYKTKSGLADKPIVKIKWKYKKCSVQEKARNGSGVGGTKKRWDKWKTNKMVDLHKIVSIITLNVESLNTKRQRLKGHCPLPNILPWERGTAVSRLAFVYTKLRTHDLGRGSSYQQNGISYAASAPWEACRAGGWVRSATWMKRCSSLKCVWSYFKSTQDCVWMSLEPVWLPGALFLMSYHQGT